MKDIRVMMVPHWDNISGHTESGIKTVVKKYFRHLPTHGVELVDSKASSFDLLAVHAGMSRSYPTDAPLCSHIHGLYWSGDYNNIQHWEWKANKDVIDSIRHATTVTVPSAWVGESLQRDLHYNPPVVHHGIDWDEWQSDLPEQDYVLGYVKNRAGADVCDPTPMGKLANRFPQQKFLGTFAPPDATLNIKATGVVSHDEMKRMIHQAQVVMSTGKETFGILHLEAMAAGKPILGFRYGGILETVQHGVNGFLATPGNYDELAEGLNYCLKHRQTLGANGREMAKKFTWERVAEQLRGIYDETLKKYHHGRSYTLDASLYKNEN